MQRTLASWLVALPAAVGGVLAAHAAAYALTEAASDGHGYLPLTQALVCAVLALGLALATLTARTGALTRPPALAFALAPPLAFLLQETAERGFSLPLEPVVLLGLLLQAPFAALAYVAARLLLRAAESLGRAPTAPARHARTTLRPVRELALRPAPLLAAPGRGPPRSTAS